VEDYQQICQHYAEIWDWDCDPGKIDDIRGPKTEKAVSNFQDTYNKEFDGNLAVDGIVGKQTWGAIYDCYVKELAGMMGTTSDGLDQYQNNLQFVSDDYRIIACGESHPIEKTELDNYRSQANRRVEVLFFDPGEEPEELNCPNPDGPYNNNECDLNVCPIHKKGVYILEYIKPEPRPPYKLSSLIFDDPFLGVMKNEEVRLLYSDGTEINTETDEDGKVEIMSGHGDFVDTEIETEHGKYTKRVFVFPADPDTNDGVWQRLVNLSYTDMEEPDVSPPNDEILASAVQAFQLEHDMDPSAEANSETKAKLEEVHDKDTRSWGDRNWPEPEDEPDDEPKAKVS
jgi:hypothetical protein